MSLFSDILGRSSGLERPAVLGANACSHGALLAEVETLAAQFAHHGVAAGSVIALALPHSRNHIAVILAAYRLDAIITAVNPRATAPEKQHMLGDSGAGFVVVPAAEKAPDSSGAVRLAVIGALALYRLPEPRDVTLQRGDRLIIYTSGSTGRPKGVVLTDDALSANICGVAEYLALSPEDSCAVFTPPSFAYAFSQILTHLWAGGAILPWPYGLLQPGELLQAIAENGITGLHANPTIFEMLLALADPSLPSPSAVRYAMSGGQPLNSSLARRMLARFPSARIVSMYGCTENAPRISYFWLPSEIPERATPWPVGKPIAGTKIKLLRHDGQEAGPGELGEILIRGTSLMRGYLGAAAETSARTRDGWFNTRDIGFLDKAGDLNLVGRSDNIFSVGHEKIVPEEIEDVIVQVSGVRDAAVGPIPHPILGLAPAALVVGNEDFSGLEMRIRAACTTALARVKVPTRIFAVPEIPRTPYGKIDRVRVSAELAGRGAAPGR